MDPPVGTSFVVLKQALDESSWTNRKNFNFDVSLGHVSPIVVWLISTEGRTRVVTVMRANKHLELKRNDVNDALIATVSVAIPMKLCKEPGRRQRHLQTWWKMQSVSRYAILFLLLQINGLDFSHPLSPSIMSVLHNFFSATTSRSNFFLSFSPAPSIYLDLT